jgi:hypothetical protein
MIAVFFIFKKSKGAKDKKSKKVQQCRAKMRET